MNYLENITRLIPAIEATLHVNHSADTSEKPGVSSSTCECCLIRMHVFLMLQFKKAFSEVPYRACFVAALSFQKPEAFKYGYSTKAKTQKKLAENETGKSDFAVKRSPNI